MKTPIVSVIMPVYNGEKYLRESIDSILNQTYSDFEFIILNDGSMDKTEEIILSYHDNRIVYVKNDKNLGIVKTLNKGIDLVKGKYIARMDADDISLPERFEKQLKFMEKNSDVCVCGSWMEYFGHSKNIWKTPENSEDIKVALLFGSPFVHPSVMMRKSIFRKLSLKYLEEYKDAEDYKLWVEMSTSCKFYNLQEVLLRYRTHNEQISKVKRVNQLTLHRKIELQYMKLLGGKCKYIPSKINDTKSCKGLIKTIGLMFCLSNLKVLDSTSVYKVLSSVIKGKIVSCIKR